jgi:hypothetical protein
MTSTRSGLKRKTLAVFSIASVMPTLFVGPPAQQWQHAYAATTPAATKALLPRTIRIPHLRQALQEQPPHPRTSLLHPPRNRDMVKLGRPKMT